MLLRLLTSAQRSRLCPAGRTDIAVASGRGIAYETLSKQAGTGSMKDVWFESFRPGDEVVSPGVTLTEADIIEFAFKYDPQPFHIDKLAAERNIYGGIIASGWQVMAMAFRMLMHTNIFGEASLGSPGVDELRWRKPVRPGDTIRTRARVRETRPSQSKPDRGLVTVDYEVLNQKDEVVMTLSAMQMLRRRPGGR